MSDVVLTESQFMMVDEYTSSQDLVWHSLNKSRTYPLTQSAIEINLRLPSMLHGKKGFERIVWAFKNVLNNAVTWLFYDFQAAPQDTATRKVPASSWWNLVNQNRRTRTHCEKIAEPGKVPISAHHPISKLCVPKITRSEGLILPDLTTQSTATANADFEYWAIETHEWLSLVTLGSPRVRKDDIIDPWLCRYAVPESESMSVAEVVLVQWSGLIPAYWIRNLLVELR